ncbi:TyeA family type III secretion system gatekeeper subunit [Robbsia sp. Bb-Pol-6]|uniref:TyeA family type III secretion system gatekeeper subunit n=1 Tax=Robbsia betulipollinis TaxID=2981849 RepID=A0ABT3ZL75_9BURK|nr:TyeA family type III secretion system gatekeeper subunit [Robbsia betulipollinis]MCY0387271.1 TyeA family type III secretion system gatekeeper subunit [Robbsia betulipollinis]
MAPIPFDAGFRTGSPVYDVRDADAADVFSRAGDAPGATATYRGAALALLPEAPSLADAAEEISLHFTEAAEMLELDEHDARADERLDLSDDDIDAYFDASKQDDGSLRRELIEGLLGNRPPGPRERLTHAHPHDPSGQFLLLQQALRHGERRLAQRTDPQDRQAALATLERLRDVAAHLALTQGPWIRADLNTIAVAGASGDTATDVRRFQTGYRDVVLGKGTLAATLQTLLGPFGGTDPRAALTRLTQALGRDLAAARPSTDAVRLHALLHDQFHAATALTVLGRCASLSSAVARTAAHLGGVAAVTDDGRPHRLMAAIVALSDERWPAANRFAALASSEGGTAAHVQIGLLTGLRAILRDLPVQIFHDGDHREQVLGAAQDALDTLIDASEADT